MKPATWTHGDLEEGCPGAAVWGSPQPVTLQAPACDPWVTAAPGHQPQLSTGTLHLTTRTAALLWPEARRNL